MSGAHDKLNQHAKATLIQRVVHQRVSVAEAARMANISRQAAYRWVRRYRSEGWAGLRPRSRAPHRSPRALEPQLVVAILEERRSSGDGPFRIGALLGVPTSTVHRVLQRHNMSRLALLDRVERTLVRYEHEAPGSLVHLDVKKLQRVPPGGGRHFDPLWQHDRRRGGHGADYLHVAIDDHSRYLYVEALPDQKAPTTEDFLVRMLANFAERNIRVERLLTDNGPNYRARRFRWATRRRGIKQRFTRPYHPQTNGKAERVIQTLLKEWAYRRPYTSNDERLAALTTFQEEYNTRRPHSALGGRPPVSRLLV